MAICVYDRFDSILMPPMAFAGGLMKSLKPHRTAAEQCYRAGAMQSACLFLLAATIGFMVFVSQNFPSAYRALDSGDIFDFSLSGVVLAVLYAAGLDGGKGARLSILSVPYGLAFLLEDIAFLLRWVVELAKTVLEAARALAMRLLSEPIAIAVLLGAALIAGTLWMALGPSPRPY